MISTLQILVKPAPESALLEAQTLVDGQGVLPAPLHGVDPDWVLPPLSAALLPSSHGRSAMIGTCCEPGCGSFSLQVRRDAQLVVWEADPDPLGSTLTGKFTFALQPYLEAIDAAAEDPRLHERGRRLARRVELALARHSDKFDAPFAREVTVPMAWQTGDGHVKLRYQGRLHAVPLADLPDDDRAACESLLLLAVNPVRLPTPLD